MSRLLLIVILFTQLLAPQAATAGAFCEFMPSGQSPEPSAVTHHAAAMHDDVSLHDEASPYHCDVAGHCSSTVVGPFMRAPGFALPLDTYTPATVVAAITSGYQTPPYRPPSPRHS